MVSKCANPECSERFLYLHQGKLYQLTPTPELESVGGGFAPLLYERFWLCDRCCKKMTLVWGGTEAKLVRLPIEPVAERPTNAGKTEIKLEPRSRAATAGWRRR
jgi:hypothetical protein